MTVSKVIVKEVAAEDMPSQSKEADKSVATLCLYSIFFSLFIMFIQFRFPYIYLERLRRRTAAPCDMRRFCSKVDVLVSYWFR